MRSLFALLLVLIPAASAQQPAGSGERIRVEGRVVRLERSGTTPVAGAKVVLHRIGRDTQGPIDSAATDASGRFRFRFLPDTTGVYILSAGHAGIEYFSSPLHTNPNAPDTSIAIAIADTASDAPIELESRDVLFHRPGQDGSREVVDILVLQNSGWRTRVAADRGKPTWMTLLPSGAIGFEVGQSDFSPDAVTRRQDTLLLFGPIAPGEKQLIVRYTIPAGPSTVRVPFQTAAGQASLMVEGRPASVTGAGFAAADSQIIEGRTFLRWRGTPGAGAVAVVQLSPATEASGWMLPVLVAVMGFGLVGAATYALRRRPAIVGSANSDALVDALARLDAKYLGRERQVTPEEWSIYQRDRALLKTELSTRLARENRRG